MTIAAMLPMLLWAQEEEKGNQQCTNYKCGHLRKDHEYDEACLECDCESFE